MEDATIIEEPITVDTSIEEPKAESQEDFQKRFQEMWIKMHSPIECSDRMPRRNDICPFCNSGKKFKNCECYKNHENIYRYNINKCKKLN